MNHNFKNHILSLVLSLGAFPFFSTNLQAQAPVVLELRATEQLPDRLRLTLFGLFFTNPVSVIVEDPGGNVTLDIVPDNPPTLVNDANFIYADLPFANFPTPQVIGRIRVTTAAGSGLSFFTATLNIPPCIVETATNASPAFYVTENGLTSLPETSKNKFTIELNKASLASLSFEKGRFSWIVNAPVSNPAPTTRFARADDDQIISPFLSFGASAEEFTNALRSIGFQVTVTDYQRTTLLGTGQFQDTYDITIWHNPDPQKRYPLYEGLGNSWVTDLDGGANPDSFGGTYSLALGGRVFSALNLFDGETTVLNQFAQCRDYLGTTLYARAGTAEVMKYEITLDQYFGPAPMLSVHANNLTFGATALTAFAVAQSQAYVKDFGETASASQTFTLHNTALSTLQLAATPVTISGPNASDFSITQQPSASIAKDGSAEFIVQFNPTSGAGLKTAVINIASATGSGKSVYSFEVKGTALQVAAEISLSAAALNGFTATYSSASTSQPITVTSVGLVSNLTITANANYEVSKNNTDFFKSITYTAAEANTAAQTVHVRLSTAACESATINGKLTVASTGADTKEATLSGGVSVGSTLNSPLSFARTSATQVTITWTDDASVGIPANTYTILRATNDICEEYIVLKAGILRTATTFTDNGTGYDTPNTPPLVEGTTYYYKVRLDQ